MQLLLDAGGDPNAFILVAGGEREAPNPSLCLAANGNKVPATRQLLERGANPNDGESIYHSAERISRQCIELLLAFGARTGQGVLQLTERVQRATGNDKFSCQP